MNSTKQFIQLFDSLARKYNSSEVFNDFLTVTVCCLAQQSMEKLYLETIKKYSKEELEVLASMLGELIINSENKNDFIGTIYEEIKSKYKAKALGQFFTPQNVADMMAKILMGNEEKTHVCDPCSGSGRMLLGFAKIKSPFKLMTTNFFGADLDHLCVKMCLINCCLNGMFGEFYHMDSLSQEVFHGYKIILKNDCPCIVKISQDAIDEINEKRNNLIIEKLAEQNSTSQLSLF